MVCEGTKMHFGTMDKSSTVDGLPLACVIDRVPKPIVTSPAGIWNKILADCTRERAEKSLLGFFSPNPLSLPVCNAVQQTQ